MTAREGGGPPPPGKEISVWEWLVAALGLACVLGAVGVLVVEALRDPSAPPDVTVRVERVERVTAGYLVTFRAVNHGDASVSSLVVRGELHASPPAASDDAADAPSPEESEATLDYVPARSERTGGLFFTRDPRAAALRLRALGYEEP